jgi:hypothetical protein
VTQRMSFAMLATLCLLLHACGGSDSNNSTAPSAPPVTGAVAGDGTCTQQASTQGIEGTGIRRKSATLTGQVTGVASNNSTMTLGSACVFTSGATVFSGDVPGRLDELRANQVVTAVGTFDPDTGNGQASSIYILSAAHGGVPTTQEVEVFAPTVRGTWYTFDGPEVAVAPTASVLIDGNPAPVSGLSIREGEVALVSGNVVFDADHNPGGLMTADSVQISHVIDGPVDSVDLTHSRLVVLGLTVLVASDTAIDDASSNLSSVQVGQRVSVAGHATASDQILATAINPSSLTGDFLITAFITSVDATQKRLTVGNLSVDYSTAALQNFAAAAPNVGDRMRVRGTRVAGVPTLKAASVTYLAPQLVGAPGGIAALHGLVTAVSPSSTVAVDGYAVTLSAAALQSCGSAPALNVMVTLEGSLQANSTVLADVFCFDPTPDFALLNVTGRVDAIDANFGTLSVLGFAVQPTITTRVTFGGATAALADIHVGDYVLGQGGVGPVNGTVLASRLERYTTPVPLVIGAAYDYIRFADPLVYVDGRAVGTDANTQFSFIGPDGNPSGEAMSRDLFFSNPHYFPYWDKICTPSLHFALKQNVDGSLTAVSVLWEPDYC